MISPESEVDETVHFDPDITWNGQKRKRRFGADAAKSEKDTVMDKGDERLPVDVDPSANTDKHMYTSN